MKKIYLISAIFLLTATLAAAQSKSNETISKQIKTLKAEKVFALSYDESAATSKLMVTAGNFDDGEAKKAGLQAMNFGMAFFYPGKTLTSTPDPINLTFWVLTKKPRFSEAHNLTVTANGETLDLGDARYVSKPKENMEYLNFQISRANLEKIAKAGGEVKLKIGTNEFKFTPEHLRIFANLLTLSDPASS